MSLLLNRWWYLPALLFGAILFVSLAIGLERITEGRKNIDASAQTSAWIAAQANLEHARLGLAVERYFAGHATRDDLLLRLDLFWSRLPLIVSGPEAALLRRLPGAGDLVAESIAVAEQIEKIALVAAPDDAAARDRILALLASIGPRLHDLSVEASGEGKTASAIQSLLNVFHVLVLAITGALIAILALGAIWLHQARRALRQRRELDAARVALVESEASLQHIIENAPVSIAFRNLEGTYRMVNPVLLSWTGRQPDDIVGKSFADIFPPDLAGRLAEIDAKAIRTGMPIAESLDVSYADGSTRFVTGTTFPVRDGDGKVLGVGTIAVDMSDIREAERILERAQRMETVGQLSGGIAHDFNNMLTVIRGNLELLEEETAGHPECARRLTAAMRASDRASDLTRRLLAFSRKQHLVPRPIDVTETFDHLETLLRRTLREDVALMIRALGDIPPIVLDASQFESAIINLALNAQDAMPDGGELTIEASFEASGQDGAAGDLVVTVSDTGTGIPRELIDRVLEPFFTTKEVGKGTGLGLSMVYGFAKQSDGAMSINSTPDRGTTITLRFPIGPAAGADAAQTSDGAPFSGRTMHVLLVEDEQDVSALITEQLRAMGHTVVAATSGAEALDLFDSLRPRPHLVITDVVLPGGLSGRRLLETLRTYDAGLPGVVISGYSEGVIDREGPLPADVVFLAKPFTRAQLAQALARVQEMKSGQTFGGVTPVTAVPGPVA